MSGDSESSREENEVGLFDLGWKLRNGWRDLLLWTAIGVSCAVVAILLIKPKYEAVAIVQVAQVADKLVEPAAYAAERMKSFAFQLGVAEALGNQDWIDDLQRSSGSSAKHLSVQLAKMTNVAGMLSPLIELRANGESQEIAKKMAERSVEELARRQAEIGKPTIDKIVLDVAIAKEKLLKTEIELEEVNKLMAHARVKDDRFTQLSLLTSFRVQKQAELFSQRQSILSLEASLIAPATQPAKALEGVVVAAKPVSPKRGLLVALGLVGGLLAGMTWVFSVDAWRRARKEHQPQAVTCPTFSDQ